MRLFFFQGHCLVGTLPAPHYVVWGQASACRNRVVRCQFLAALIRDEID